MGGRLDKSNDGNQDYFVQAFVECGNAKDCIPQNGLFWTWIIGLYSEESWLYDSDNGLMKYYQVSCPASFVLDGNFDPAKIKQSAQTKDTKCRVSHLEVRQTSEADKTHLDKMLHRIWEIDKDTQRILCRHGKNLLLLSQNATLKNESLFCTALSERAHFGRFCKTLGQIAVFYIQVINSKNWEYNRDTCKNCT